jgi:L-ribulokinase
MATAVAAYPRWKQGLYCQPSKQMFRQHPLDYLESLEMAMHDCLAQLSPSVVSQIKGLAADTTGSTPVAVNESGIPLALLPGFEENPNAMFVLWKDHTALKEAEEINNYAAKQTVNYLQFVGGIYSSEWYWAKLLKVLRDDVAVRAATVSWVEHSDWIPFVLTGGKHISALKRNVCAAGHKALWAGQFGGFPPDHFFAGIDPLLQGFTHHLPSKTYEAGYPAGFICPEWAARLGLPENVVVSIGVMDAHAGAVGGEIEPFQLAKVMGTSTCDMLVAPIADLEEKCVKGISGQVVGSIIPGMVGLEAGQSAFGDVFAWFARLLSFPIKTFYPQILEEDFSAKMLHHLGELASALPLNETDPLALDWFNGRRTPDADHSVKAAIFNLDLGAEAPIIFRSLVEATCFGARAIAERFVNEGVRIDAVIGLGGVARKSAFVMQTLADVMQRPIKVHSSDQTCALGAAMFASVAAGIYKDVPAAMRNMGHGFEKTYHPDKSRKAYYQKHFQLYQQLGDVVPAMLRNK